MGKKAQKMYDKDKAPRLGRGEKGNVEVKSGKKPSEKQKDADETEAGTEGVLSDEHKINDRREMFHRHMTESMAMYHKHEMEVGSGGEDMGERHAAERKDMYKKHENEHKSLAKRHGSPVETKSEEGDKNKGEKKKAEASKAGEKAKDKE